MKAEDFRIGNFIWLHDSLHKVRIATLETLIMSPDTHNYKPVLLNEEWLLKFGFDKVDNYTFNLNDGYMTLSVEDEDWEDLCLDVFIRTANMEKPFYITAIEYVHQLQNLYFTLTDEELQIKVEA